MAVTNAERFVALFYTRDKSAVVVIDLDITIRTIRAGKFERLQIISAELIDLLRRISAQDQRVKRQTASTHFAIEREHGTRCRVAIVSQPSMLNRLPMMQHH